MYIVTVVFGYTLDIFLLFSFLCLFILLKYSLFLFRINFHFVSKLSITYFLGNASSGDQAAETVQKEGWGVYIL